MTDNMSEAVRGMLFEALSIIDLNAVDRLVQHHHSSASVLEAQNDTLDATRDEVGDGYRLIAS